MSIVPLLLGSLLLATTKPSKPAATPAPERLSRIVPAGPIPADFRGDPGDQIPVFEGRNGKPLGFWEKSPNSSTRRDWNETWWRHLSNRRDLATWNEVSFGDPVTTYLRKVKDVVLASRPDLRDKIRIYTSLSPYVNACTLPDGLVEFDVGLLARMTDESQVAFVIAHEAAHYVLRHSQDAWWENRTYNGTDRWVRSRFQHSRENEAEADSLGMVLIAASRYSADGIDSVFGILDASSNAAGRRAWTAEALRGFPDLAISDSFWLDPSRVSWSVPSTEDSDSLQDHPAIPKRRAAAKRFFAETPHQGEEWIVGRQEFEHARLLASRETARSWMEADQPAAALFDAWNLLESAPDDPDLRSIRNRALFQLAMDRSAKRRSIPRARRIRILGAYQTLDHFLNRLDDTRMLALGLLAAREEARLHPEDSSARGAIAELEGEWALSLPRHLEYLRDTSRIARSLRPQKPVLDIVRRELPELSGGIAPLPPVADTGNRPIAGTSLYLAEITWTGTPYAKGLGGIETGRAIVREHLSLQLAGSGVRLVAPDPSRWTADSLAPLRRHTAIKDWLKERFDPRGAVRFRPRLAKLRKDLAEVGADKVLVLSFQVGYTDWTLSPVNRLLSGGRPRIDTDLFLFAVVLDPRDGSVVRFARAPVWESPTPERLAETSRRLAKELLETR